MQIFMINSIHLYFNVLIFESFLSKTLKSNALKILISCFTKMTMKKRNKENDIL